MKKHLIAAAALATLSTAAFAQSATVYGIVDLSVSSTSKALQLQSDGATTAAQGRVSGLTDAVWMPSVFGITGTEDLGGGMKATFNLESDINVDTGALSGASGSKLFGRKSNVAVSGNFGELKLGKDIDQIFLQGFIDNIRNSHSASGFMAHALKDYVTIGSLQYVNEKSVFAQNMVRYTTPSLGGFKVAVQHTFGEVAGASGTNKSDSVLATYAMGGATFAAGHKKVSKLLQSDVTATTASEAITAADDVEHKLSYLGATYTFGAVKLAATYHQSKWSEAGVEGMKTTTTELGAAYTINPKLVAAVNYVKQKDQETGSAKVDGDITSVSLKYSLSKRTNLWALASRADSKETLVLGANYANALTTEKSSSYSLGITHSF